MPVNGAIGICMSLIYQLSVQNLSPNVGTGGTLVSRCLKSQKYWFFKGFSWERKIHLSLLDKSSPSYGG